MAELHPKTVRRRILEFLYDGYLASPLRLYEPKDILATGRVPKDTLFVNACYLHDRGLIEVKHGYTPGMFEAARIVPAGVDFVESRVLFDTTFPPDPSDLEEAARLLPSLMERLVEEADFAPLDGEERVTLLRDVQYLREELSRPVERWRRLVVWTFLSWLEGYRADGELVLPTLPEVRAAAQHAAAERVRMDRSG